MNKTTDINTKDLDDLDETKISSVSENKEDSLEQKFARELNLYKKIARYSLLSIGIWLILLFSLRYLHLINSCERVIDIYLKTKDWQVYVIYGISLAFTASMTVGVFVAMQKYLRSLKSK